MTESSSRVALVAGATGAVGSALVQILLESPQYRKVTVLARTSLGLRHPKLEEHLLSFDQLSQNPEFLQAEDVFCCLGLIMKKAGSKEAFYKVDFTYPHEIARLSLKNGAKRYFLVSSVGANPDSPFYYLRVKGEIERALSQMAFEALHIFRPGLIHGPRKEFRLNETAALLFFKLFGVFFLGKARRYVPTAAAVIAKAMAVAADALDRKGIYFYDAPEIKRIAAVERVGP